MENDDNNQVFVPPEQRGVEQPSDEHLSSSVQAPQQRHQQSSQDGEPRPPVMTTMASTASEIVANRCQVDGCMADLSGLRRYFRRYHVCEIHIRSQVVLIGGRKVRFCDQCSTFHPLDLFDNNRRTCREKLEQNRLKRRIRKAQSAGQQAAPSAAVLAAAVAAATGAAAGGTGAQQSDDADSDDRPGNVGMAGEGEDAPVPRVQGARNGVRKRSSGISLQGARRQQPAARQSAGLDVTNALKVYRTPAGQQAKRDSQSPEPENDEMGRRTPGAGGGPRDDAAWGAVGMVMDTEAAYGGAMVAVNDSRDANLGAASKRGRPVELVGFASDWTRVNHHDLRDQEQVQAAYNIPRDTGMYSPQSQAQLLGTQGPHALRSQPFKGDQVLPQLPQQQQQSLSTGNWEVATGGVVVFDRHPQPAPQGSWRQHGGSMPNMPQGPPASPPGWPLGETRATWHSMPAAVLPASGGAAPDRHVLPDRSLHDGVARLAAGHPMSSGGYQRQTQTPQVQSGFSFPAPNNLGGSEGGFGGTAGPLDRMGGRLVTHMDSGAGAPAVTLLAQVMRTEPELRKQPHRPSQTGPESMAPTKLAVPSGVASGSTDMVTGSDGLTPAQQAAFRLQYDAGMLSSSRNVILASQPQPQSGTNVPKQWLAVPLDPQEQQQLQRQEIVGYTLPGPTHQAAETWTGNGTAQGVVWPQYGTVHARAHGVSAAPVAAFGVPLAMLGDRRMSAGSSVYTADEEAQAVGLDDQDVSSLAREAVAVASGAHGGPPQQSIEEAPSLLNSQSFKEDVDRENANALIWETRHREQLEQEQHHRMQMLAEQQHLHKQQQVQILVSIPNHHQLQAFHGDQRVTLLDHTHQKEDQRIFKVLQQPQQHQPQSSLLQHIREQGVVSNPDLSRVDNWQKPPQQPAQPRAPQMQACHQDGAANSFGRLAAPNGYPLSVFQLQGPVDDLDTDTEYPQQPLQQSNAVSFRVGNPGANGQVTAVGQQPFAPPTVAPRPLLPTRQPTASWPGSGASWGPAHGDACVSRSAYEAQLPQQPQPQDASSIGHGTHQHMQQLSNSLAGVDPRDQQLILSTLMKFAAHPPRKVATGQEQAPMGPPACDVQDRGGDAVTGGGGGGGGGTYVLQQDRGAALLQPPPPQQQPQSTAHDFGSRQGTAAYHAKLNAIQDGTQQIALGESDLQAFDSVAISEVFGEARGGLQLLDSVEFSQIQELRINVPVAAECGAAGVQGGPPTPPPHGGDGFAGSHGGLGRTAVEEERWVGSSSNSQIVGRPWQHQHQHGRGAGEYANGGEFIALPPNDEVRVWERQQQQQQRQERAVSHGVLLGDDCRLQQHLNSQPEHQQSQGYRPQGWSQQQQQQHAEDLRDGCHPHAMYGMPYGTEGVPCTGPGGGAGAQNLSHMALKLSHARADSLRSDLVERMQEGLRGGGAALLPATLREGCVEVLVEVMHSCPSSELSRRLFQLDEAGSPNLEGCNPTVAAVISASEQLRAWVGAEIFDACERVTMQLLRGPVLDCSPGTLPKLQSWQTAMRNAGLDFAVNWPDMLMLADTGPPVLVADSVKAQQIEVHAPSELESRRGLVQLNIRIAGGACSLGIVEAEAVAVTESRAAAAAMDQADAAIGLKSWKERRSSRSPLGRPLEQPGAGPWNITARAAGEETQLPIELSVPKLRCDTTFAFISTRGLAKTCDLPRSLPSSQAVESPAVAGSAETAPCIASAKMSEAETVTEQNTSGATALDPRSGDCAACMARVGPPPYSRAVSDAADLLRSCFMATMPSSQPSSPIFASQRHQSQPQRLQGCALRPLVHSEIAGALMGPEQEQVEKVQEVLPRVHLARSRSKSDDGCIPGCCSSKLSGAGGTSTPRARPPQLNNNSLTRPSSSRRKVMQAYASGNTAVVPAAVAAGGIRSLDALSRRGSLCSTTTLTTAMTLHERLSCRSTSTVLTNSSTLHERTSLRSEWSCISTLTSFGGVMGSAGGFINGSGGGCGICEAAPYSGVGQPVQLPAASALSSCYEQTLASIYSSGTGLASAATNGGLKNLENGSPQKNCGEKCRPGMPPPALAFVADAAGGPVLGAHPPEAGRALSSTRAQPSFKILVPDSLSTQPESDHEGGSLTPRLAKAPAPVTSPLEAAAVRGACTEDTMAAAPAQRHYGVLDESDRVHPSGVGRVLAGLRGRLTSLRLQLPVLPRAGLALLEATGGHAVAGCWPVLVVETAAQRSELIALWTDLVNAGREKDWRGVAADLGLVLGNLPRRTPTCEFDSLRGAPERLERDGDDGIGNVMEQMSIPSLPAVASANSNISAGGSCTRYAPVVDSAFADAIDEATTTAFGENLDVHGHDADSALPLPRKTHLMVATWSRDNHDGPYCDSVRSLESAYQESWGTIATRQSTVSEHAPQASLSRGATLASTSSGSSGSGGKVSRGVASSNDSSSCASDGCTLYATDPELCDASTLVTGHGAYSDAPARQGTASTSSGYVAISAVTAASSSPFGSVPAGTGSETEERETGKLAAVVAVDEEEEEGKQPPAVADRDCMLQRESEVSLALGLGDGDAEDDLSMAVVTKFLAGLRMVADAVSVDSDNGGADSSDRKRVAVAGVLEGVPLGTGPGDGHALEQHRTREEVGVKQVAGKACSSPTRPPQPPMLLLPATAIGLSNEARVALHAAVSRLRSRLDVRKMPALWELLERVELEDGS